MKRKNLIRTAVAASLLAVGTGAFAQADNSNSATDPSYYGSWYYWNPFVVSPSVEVYTYRDYVTPRWYRDGPRVVYQGPAYYDSWAFYHYPSSTVTATVTAPGYMGPRDVRP